MGGIGARHVASDYLLLEYFDRAIAFDRRGTSDVITHQGFGRCCSDKFAEALCDQLNNQGLLYMPSDAGVYTDTAEFTDIISECTNISVGYLNEHRKEETLNLPHYLALASAVVAVDWEGLPTYRDPLEDGVYGVELIDAWEGRTWH